jgi:hypothetical protein
MSARHLLSQVQGGARLFWLLDLQWAGGVIRVADGDLEVQTDDGDLLKYSPGLDSPEMEEAIELLTDMSAAPASATISVLLPVDVPRLVALGHDLSGAIGTLSRWVEGTTLEARRVVLVGIVSDPEYETEDDPVRFTLEANVWQDSTEFPDPEAAVLADNWDDAMILSLALSDFELAYPIVIGRPGVVSTMITSVGWITGSAGVWVDKQNTAAGGGNVGDLTLVIAGHHVTATEVYANTDGYTTGTRFLVRNGYDRQEHPVAFLSWWGTKTAGADDFTYSAGPYGFVAGPPTSLGHNAVNVEFQPASGVDRPVYIGWLDSTDGGGGMQGPNGQTIETAGEVLEWLLGLTSIKVDRGRCAVAGSLLSRFKLGFTIETGVKPWEWAKEHLLPLLPVTIVSGPDGVYPLVWRYWATSADAVHHLDLDIDPGIERSSAVRVDRSKIVNDWTLRYAYTRRTGSFRGVARLGAEGLSVGLPSMHCTISQRRYRRPDGDPLVIAESMDTVCIYDDSTAQAVLSWQALAYALARRRVSYRVPLSRYPSIERGQVITVTDPDLYLSSQVALVESVKTDGSPTCDVGLLLIEDPGRDMRLGAVS